MNLVLFEKPFDECTLPLSDVRATHLRTVLKVGVGSHVHVGFLNSDRALCEVIALDNVHGLRLRVIQRVPAPPLLPIVVCIGLPRPHTARKVLYDAAVLGVAKVIFFESDHGEPSYRNSRLWQKDEWRERLLNGLAQSYATALPTIEHAQSLELALARIGEMDTPNLIALDNYESNCPLQACCDTQSSPVQQALSHTLALGGERGWSARERQLLRSALAKLAHLGPRVMRVEGAFYAAVSILAANLWWHSDTAASIENLRPV